MNYCTVADVRSVIKTFAGDIDDDNDGRPTISSLDIQDLIGEASPMVIMDYQLRYSIEVIDSYGPEPEDYPDAIRRLAALRTAELVYNRIGSVSVERNKALKELFAGEISKYRRVITAGAVRDRAGQLVPSQGGPSARNHLDTTQIDEVYARGPRYY